ncbi:uncharacterized protein JCM15063_006557 [Sporobolomyces koalae]|uniref:uncharacterized protein n=1 Tax=Sporobolomyces koalae TaxID=500713 RepID=UPI003171B367
MLFTRIAFPLLALVASVVATSSPSSGHDSSALEKRHNKPAPAKCGCELSVESSIRSATKQIKHAGASIKTACAANKKKGNAAIVASVKPHLVEISVSLKSVSAAVRIHKIDLLHAELDVKGLAKLVAGLLNACVTALLPLHIIIKSSLGLRLLLTVHLKLIGLELVAILKTLFYVCDGLLEAVLGLVNGTVFVVLHGLGNIFAGVFGQLGLNLGLGCF